MELLLIASCVAILVLVVAVYLLHKKIDELGFEIGKQIHFSRELEERRVDTLLANVVDSRERVLDRIDKRAEPREKPIL